mgnify:CR=1 FL=1
MCDGDEYNVWFVFFFFQAEDGIRDLVRSRGLGDVYKRQYEYCRKHIPDNSIFDLSGFHLNKKYDLYRNGIIRLEDVPADAEPVSYTHLTLPTSDLV